MRWLGWIVVGWCVVVSVVSCGGECKYGIQIADYNTSGLKCAASCDCSNLKYEGYCVSGVCLSSERTSAQRKGEIRPCKLQQKVGACEWGKQEAQPEPLKELVWGDCIPPTLRPENTLDTCFDNEDNDCNGLTDLNDLGCAAFCRVGDTKTCYRGPEATQHVGECRGGTISCKSDRTWGVCEGEALPQKETCDGKDNNCNGQTDESCGCTKDDDCTNGWRCESGSCRLVSCVPPQQRCGSECVDAQRHLFHCGRCDARCDGGKICQDGACRCSDAWSECGGVCVDTKVDPLHCGACGNACQDRKRCQQGKCVCKANFSDCSANCVDLSSDDSHCGACGKACQSFERCNKGTCECRDSKGICEGVCVDIASDNDHCGGCNQPCDLLREQCVGGACACKTSHTRCGGTCVDTQRASAHCGGCGKACAVGEVCRSGVCSSLLSVSVGLEHTCAVTLCGHLKCWGDGLFGKIGDGRTLERHAPSRSVDLGIASGRQVRQVALGDGHTCALSTDALLFCWGKNTMGQLGYGHDRDLQAPAAVAVVFPKGRFVLQVAAGTTHTCAVLDDQSLRCWGDNLFGQLGYNDRQNRPAPRADAIDVGTGRRVKAVAAGDSLTCALLDNATVKCWGKNDYGQLGYGDATPRFAPSILPIDVGAGRSVKSLSVGLADVCVILDDNTVKCWGKNNRGQLGYGDTTNRNKPDTAVISFGTNRKATQLFSGFGEHRCVLLDDGTARCWGADDKGQLGDGDSGQGKQQTAPASVPVDFGVGRSATSLSVGASHSCAVLDNQQVVCWGDNTKGQLGSGDTVSRSQISGEFIVFRQAICGGVCVDTDTSRHCGQCSVACSSSEICSVGRCVPRVTAIAAQEQRTCSSQNGLLKCWGRNDKGQLGYGDTAPREAPSVAPIDLGVGRTARSVAPGEDHLCALLDNGTVKCWGYNGAGQLGYGDTTQRTAPSVDSIDLGVGRFAKSISAGGSFTCALLDNNTLKCWGANNYGQLGYGDGAPRYAPPLAPIDLGTGRTASFLATANTHACAILDNGALKCWGRNDYGQLGYGDTTQRNAPPAVAVDLGAGRTAKRVALGGWFACAILDDGTVKCWGANHDGQLGYGDTTNRTAPSAAAVELGLGRTAKELSLGLSHACALLDDATVKCWGDLTYQIPGVSLVLVSSPPFAPLDIGSGRTATSIASGNLHTCALLDDGSVKCWGANTKGQLGYGDFVDRSVSDVFPLPFR